MRFDRNSIGAKVPGEKAVGFCGESVEICIQGHFLMLHKTRVHLGLKNVSTYQKMPCLCESLTIIKRGAQTSKPIATKFYMRILEWSTDVHTKFHQSTSSGSVDICKLSF